MLRSVRVMIAMRELSLQAARGEAPSSDELERPIDKSSEARRRATPKPAPSPAQAQQAGADSQEILRWLKVYFESRTERWAGHEPRTKRISTTEVIDGGTLTTRSIDSSAR